MGYLNITGRAASWTDAGQNRPGRTTPKADPMTTQLKIDFVSDVSCPWCVIGLKALDQALDRVGSDIQAELHFQPFELNPKMVPEGQEITEHITQKYGITPAQAQVN